MKRLLITGAGGFIGRRCVVLAKARGFDVHTFDRRACDLLTDDVKPLLARVKPTHLLHLAWVTTPGEYWTSPLNARWAEASYKLVDAFVASGGKRIVTAGTCAEYDWSAGRCVEGKTPLSEASPYARAKHAVRQHMDNLGLNAAWARVFFAYGPGEPPQRLVSSTIAHLLAGETAACSAGTHRRDFIHVDDAADAMVRLLDSDVCGPINVGSGEAPTIRNIVETIGEIIGRANLLQFDTAPIKEPPLVVADTARLREAIGFTPTHNLTSGLRDTIDAIKAVKS